MPNQPPLNPDALANLRLLADRATEEVRHAVIEPDILHKLLDLATAQPVVNSVEVIPAKMRMLAWEGGEFEVGEIPEGHVLVGFEMATDRAWSMADKVTIRIERKDTTNGR